MFGRCSEKTHALEVAEVKLTRDEYTAILRNERPRIERPFTEGEGPPCEHGEEIPLKTLPSLAGPVPQVSLTILLWRRSKRGSWVANYKVKDDRPLYVARQPGYTRDAEQSVDAGAPVLDEATEKRFAAEAKLTRIERRRDRDDAKEARKKRQRQIRERLGRACDGLTPEGAMELLARIERECQEAENDKEAA